MEKSVIRRIVEFSVKNKSIIILIVAFLVLFGIYALIRMPKQEFPVFSIRQDWWWASIPEPPPNRWRSS